MIRFFNTLSGTIEDFKPLQKGKVRLYTCGPTVYDYAHIGNFRAYLFEDLLKRYLVYSGFEVTHVMNITDIDDKTIKGAASEGVSLDNFTEKYISAFFHDIDSLNIARADYYPRATEHIPEMVRVIKILLDKGAAYISKDRSIYFDISKFPDYGKLSKIDLSRLQSGSRIESDEYSKDNPTDFVLWKARKEGEPFWETDLGPGRPGWHIECSVMSAKYLGESFDIHCGGIDNIFPHHENEIAQSETYTGKPFVKYWMHCQHLVVDGQKMSKSLGNTYTLRDLISRGIRPPALRLLLLSTHYRKILSFSEEALNQADASVRRIRDFAHILKSIRNKHGQTREAVLLAEEMKTRFSEGLALDLNVSQALTGLFEMIKKANIIISKKELSTAGADALANALKDIDRILGILDEEGQEDLAPDLMEMIRLREKARRNRDFSEADRIRDELLRKGIILEDTKDGVRWKKSS